MNAELTDAYIKTMFGCNAVRVPMNFIIQDMASEKEGPMLVAVAQAQGPSITPVFFGGKFSHTLVLGDVVIRPRLVIGSNHLRGAGLAGIAQDGFADPSVWLNEGKVLIHPDGGPVA